MKRFDQLLQLGLPRNIAARLGETEAPRPVMRVEASTDGDVGEISIYENIGLDWWTGEGMTAQKFGDLLASMSGKSKIVLRINSPGGDVWDGLTIHNQILQQTTATEVRIEGIAASAASVIAIAADRTLMAQASQMMIHNAWTWARGNAAEMRQVADILEKIDGQMAGLYASKGGKPVEHYAELMAADTYMTPDEAIAHGLADGLIETPKKQSAKAEAAAPIRNKAKLFCLRQRLA